MLTLVLAAACGVFLAFANGSNDNFKGVATLYGSGSLSYRKALACATIAQILGSLAALILSQGLLAAFSGKGLVPGAVSGSPAFLLAVGIAAATTVILATRLGFPISTTHALTGALVGAGLVGSSVAGVNFSWLGSSFLAPLLVSPVLAVALAAAGYLGARRAGSKIGVTKETCICLGPEVVQVVPVGESAAVALQAAQTIAVGTQASCVERYQGQFLGVQAGQLLDGLHYLSGGAVCFARALNDTPKIAAVALVGGAISPAAAISGAAVAMAIGGWVGSKRIAETMSHKVTPMNPGQGLSANCVTGALVIFASKLGLPVSTTHVACGSIFGIGAVTKKADPKTIGGILLAWVTTLPVAAVLSAVCFVGLKHWLG